MIVVRRFLMSFLRKKLRIEMVLSKWVRLSSRYLFTAFFFVAPSNLNFANVQQTDFVLSHNESCLGSHFSPMIFLGKNVKNETIMSTLIQQLFRLCGVFAKTRCKSFVRPKFLFMIAFCERVFFFGFLFEIVRENQFSGVFFESDFFTCFLHLQLAGTLWSFTQRVLFSRD